MVNAHDEGQPGARVDISGGEDERRVLARAAWSGVKGLPPGPMTIKGSATLRSQGNVP